MQIPVFPCSVTEKTRQLEMNNDSTVEIGIAGLNFRTSYAAERTIDT